MGQGSIVARQPAELHRRQFEIIARLGKRLGQAQRSLETELWNSRHRRRGEDKGPRDALRTGAPPSVSPPDERCVTSLAIRLPGVSVTAGVKLSALESKADGTALNRIGLLRARSQLKTEKPARVERVRIVRCA